MKVARTVLKPRLLRNEDLRATKDTLLSITLQAKIACKMLIKYNEKKVKE